MTDQKRIEMWWRYALGWRLYWDRYVENIKGRLTPGDPS